MQKAPIGRLMAGTVFLLAACSGGEEDRQSAAANPCAVNPCAMANPCAAGMGKIDASKVTQGSKELNAHGNSSAELVAMGERLWNDKSMSKAGATSCSTCHMDKYGMMKASFAEPYPHRVEMAYERAGLAKVSAAEMVQLCMVIPMQNDPLDWSSVELAALSEYVTSIQGGFDASMASGMNPCNPCMGENPCNPCAGMNPCNPCQGKGGN
jgi:hypothetical protein